MGATHVTGSIPVPFTIPNNGFGQMLGGAQVSVKSERRAWYAANVEPMPCEDRASAEFLAWRDRANAHMVTLCVPGSAELKPVADVAPVVELRTRQASVAAPAKTDRAEYDAWVDAQLRVYGDYIGAGGWSDDMFDSAKVARSGREFAPFKGSLKSNLPYLNGDAKLALDNGIIRWVTFAEFKAERAELRATEAAEYAAQAEAYAAGNCVMCLASDCECVEIEWAA